MSQSYAAAAPSEHGSGKRKNPTKQKPAGEQNVKFTISLSPRSVAALNKIKDVTDAATDSEVFRNALRLHLMLLNASIDGKKLIIRDEAGENAEVAVNLFAPG